MSKSKSAEPKVVSEEELLSRIKELEAKVAEGEEGAMKRVCKALKIDEEEVIAEEAKKPEDIIRFHCPYPVGINGREYFGLVEAPLSIYRSIQHTLSVRRQRILNETIGNDHLIKEINGGGFKAEVVSRINDIGEKVS